MAQLKKERLRLQTANWVRALLCLVSAIHGDPVRLRRLATEHLVQHARQRERQVVRADEEKPSAGLRCYTGMEIQPEAGHGQSKCYRPVMAGRVRKNA